MTTLHTPACSQYDDTSVVTMIHPLWGVGYAAYAITTRGQEREILTSLAYPYPQVSCHLCRYYSLLPLDIY